MIVWYLIHPTCIRLVDQPIQCTLHSSVIIETTQQEIEQKNKYHEAVLELYEDAGKETFRILKEKGVFVVKCQDEICSNRQRFIHVELIQTYTEMGFIAEDFFVIVRTNKPGVSRAIKQVHARKTIPIFWFFGSPQIQKHLEVARMNPIDLLAEIIKEQAPDDIWQGSPIIGYRLLGNTNRRKVGEKFIRRYLEHYGINARSNGNRTSKTDMQIGNIGFEVKTASLEANGTFQYNHVRLDRQYNYLLCVGLCPNNVVYSLWRKGDIAEGTAGRLVRMAEEQSVTFKLTKRLDEMLSLDSFIPEIQSVISSS